MKKLLVLFLSALLIVTVLAGCAASDEPADTSDGASDEIDWANVTYSDGEYSAETDYDERGSKGVIKITIVEGEISEVSFDEVNEDGSRKSEDAYRDNFLERNEVDIREAYAHLVNELVSKQNPEEVDAYTGATSSSGLFEQLAKEALSKAAQ